MKIKIIALLCFFSSCSLPSYTIYSEKDSGLDFSKGKWIVYCNNSSNDICSKAIVDFNEILGNRASEAHMIKGLILPSNFTLNLPKNEIHKLTATCDYDYLISLNDKTLENQLTSINIGKNKEQFGKNNSVFVTIEVYDLKKETLIFSKTVKGLSSRGKENSDLNFAADERQLRNSAYKKLIQNIKEKSILHK